MEEIWKDIEGYTGHYKVSNKGNVKSLKRIILRKDGSWLPIKGKFLPQRKNTSGYLQVSLYKNTKRKRFFVQRLVAFAFIGRNENKPEVNHKDGKKENNNDSNLEWMTHKENMNHAIKSGLKNLQSPCKIVKKVADEIRELYKQGKSQTNLSKMFSLSVTSIWRIVHNKTYL